MESQSKHHKWNFWQVIIPSLLTALTTIFVTYFTVIKSETENTIMQVNTDREKELSRPVEVISDGNPHQNPYPNRLLISGYCNATVQSKVIEASTGESADRLSVVITSSGTDRIGVTFVVPPNYYYKIKWDKVEGGGADFTGWRL